VASIVLEHYTWLEYVGMNALTNDKIEVLAGESIITVPDRSSKAVKIMQDKTPSFQELDIDARILDMTSGLSDDKLNTKGWYNDAIEDVFHEFFNGAESNK
jgi:hypothetical protein